MLHQFHSFVNLNSNNIYTKYKSILTSHNLTWLHNTFWTQVDSVKARYQLELPYEKEKMLLCGVQLQSASRLDRWDQPFGSANVCGRRATDFCRAAIHLRHVGNLKEGFSAPCQGCNCLIMQPRVAATGRWQEWLEKRILTKPFPGQTLMRLAISVTRWKKVDQNGAQGNCEASWWSKDNREISYAEF